MGNYSVWCFTLLWSITSFLNCLLQFSFLFFLGSLYCGTCVWVCLSQESVLLFGLHKWKKKNNKKNQPNKKNTEVKRNPPRNVLHNASSNTCVILSLYTDTITMQDWALMHRLNLPQTSAVWARDTSLPHMDTSIRSSYGSKVWDLSDFPESMNQWWEDLTEPRGAHPQQMMHLHLI